MHKMIIDDYTWNLAAEVAKRRGSDPATVLENIIIGYAMPHMMGQASSPIEPVSHEGAEQTTVDTKLTV